MSSGIGLAVWEVKWPKGGQPDTQIAFSAKGSTLRTTGILLEISIGSLQAGSDVRSDSTFKSFILRRNPCAHVDSGLLRV